MPPLPPEQCPDSQAAAREPFVVWLPPTLPALSCLTLFTAQTPCAAQFTPSLTHSRASSLLSIFFFVNLFLHISYQQHPRLQNGVSSTSEGETHGCQTTGAAKLGTGSGFHP